MADSRSLREQRDELRISLDEIMERNDSIDDIESIERLEKGTAQMAELDNQIRSAEAREAYEAAKKTVSGSYSFRGEADTPSGEGEYRFVMNGSDVRIEGRAMSVDGQGNSSSLPGMPDTSWGNYSAAIPVDLQAEMIRRLPENTVVRRFFSSMQYANDIELQRVASRVTVADANGENVSTGDGEVGYKTEGGTYQNVDMSLERVRVNNFKSTAKSQVTEEFMRDARGKAVSELLLQHTEAHALWWDKTYAAGLGGVSGPEACWDVTATGFSSDVPQTTISISAASGASASATWVDALTNLRYSIIPAQYWGGLRWMMSQEGFAELAGLLDKNDRPIFQPLLTGSPATDTAAGTLLGLPVFVGNNLPNATVAAGNTCAILAHEQDYRIFDRMPYSQSIDPYSAADTGEVVYRTRMRSDARWLRPFAAGALVWAL